MRGPSDLNINPNPCGRDQWAALKRVLQNIQNVLAAMANGEGTLLRFRLTEDLSPGGSAGANINRFDETGFASQRSGVVYDEHELWFGKSGNSGWCTGRDNSQDNYSVVLLPATLGLADNSGEGGGTVGGDFDSDLTIITNLFTQYGASLPPLGVWDLFGTLTQTLTFGGTANMTIDGTPLVIPVHDFLLSSGETIVSGNPVVVNWNVVKKWYGVVATRCA